MVGVNGDADSLGPGVFRVGLGAVTETNVIGNDWFSQELEQSEKKESRFSLCLVKKKVIKSYNTNKLNKYNIII